MEKQKFCLYETFVFSCEKLLQNYNNAAYLRTWFSRSINIIGKTTSTIFQDEKYKKKFVI